MNKEVLYDLVIVSIKRNFVLEPTLYDDILASKAIEGNTMLPHMVVLALCKKLSIPESIYKLHLRLSDKRLNELNTRVCKLIIDNEIKFKTKVRLCEKMVNHILKQNKI